LPTILAHELLLGVGQVAGATSPTTSVASASMVGTGSSSSGSNNLNANAPLGNICNTLPHSPSGLSNNHLPLNRNMVMLRNHLRKNTSGNASQVLHDDNNKDQ